MRIFHRSISILVAVLCVAATNISAQTQIELRPESRTSLSDAATVYRYVFENERFLTRRMVIEFNDQGKGTFSYLKKEDAEETSSPLTVSAAVLSQVKGLFEELRFLESQVEYQHKKDFSHLGRVTLMMQRKDRERTVTFNYTDHTAVNKLVEIFRNIATQETRIYELQNIRNSDPISTPTQMRLLESELKSNHIADPTGLIPLLQEIKMDESVPLIARNHAERLIKLIQKTK